MRKTLKFTLGFIVCCVIAACSPTISAFDQVSYQQVTAAKVDVISLMAEATESYTVHAAEVKAVQREIDKAIEYDKHRGLNEITNRMWQIMNDPEANLFGGFLVKWRKEGTCNAVYVQEKIKQVSTSFDQIAELEMKKNKSGN